VHAAENADANGFDTYFGLATFDDVGERKAANALQMCSLFLDLDCGEGKELPRARARRLRHCGLSARPSASPRPIMVSSGYGVHVYWPLSEAVSVADWNARGSRSQARLRRPMACTATPA